MIGCSEKLGGISKSEKMSFQMVMERNYAEKVPAWVLMLGTNSKWKPDEWSTLGFSGRKNLIGNGTEFENDERSQWSDFRSDTELENWGDCDNP